MTAQKKRRVLLNEASIIFLANYYGSGLHLLIAKVKDNDGVEMWRCYRQSGFSTVRSPIGTGKFKTAEKAWEWFVEYDESTRTKNATDALKQVA